MHKEEPNKTVIVIKIKIIMFHSEQQLNCQNLYRKTNEQKYLKLVCENKTMRCGIWGLTINVLAVCINKAIVIKEQCIGTGIGMSTQTGQYTKGSCT